MGKWLKFWLCVIKILEKFSSLLLLLFFLFPSMGQSMWKIKLIAMRWWEWAIKIEANIVCFLFSVHIVPTVRGRQIHISRFGRISLLPKPYENMLQSYQWSSVVREYWKLKFGWDSPVESNLFNNLLLEFKIGWFAAKEREPLVSNWVRSGYHLWGTGLQTFLFTASWNLKQKFTMIAIMHLFLLFFHTNLFQT